MPLDDLVTLAEYGFAAKEHASLTEHGGSGAMVRIK